MFSYEQIREEVDIYSMGILLYWMIHGFSPFRENLTSDKKLKYLKNKPVFTYNKHISIEAKDLLSKCLSWLPKDRIKLQEIYGHPWMRLNEEKTGIDISYMKLYYSSRFPPLCGVRRRTTQQTIYGGKFNTGQRTTSMSNLHDSKSILKQISSENIFGQKSSKGPKCDEGQIFKTLCNLPILEEGDNVDNGSNPRTELSIEEQTITRETNKQTNPNILKISQSYHKLAKENSFYKEKMRLLGDSRPKKQAKKGGFWNQFVSFIGCAQAREYD